MSARLMITAPFSQLMYDCFLRRFLSDCGAEGQALFLGPLQVGSTVLHWKSRGKVPASTSLSPVCLLEKMQLFWDCRRRVLWLPTERRRGEQLPGALQEKCDSSTQQAERCLAAEWKDLGVAVVSSEMKRQHLNNQVFCLFSSSALMGTGSLGANL